MQQLKYYAPHVRFQRGICLMEDVDYAAIMKTSVTKRSCTGLTTKANEICSKHKPGRTDSLVSRGCLVCCWATCRLGNV